MSKKLDSFEIMYPRLVKLSLFDSFNSGSEEDLRIMKCIYDQLQFKKFNKNDIIIKEGDEGDEFFILYSGSIKISKKTIAGDTLALANLDASQDVFFGEIALISDDTRSATVIADSECDVLVLSREDFFNICEKEPVLGYRVIIQLARRMADNIRKANNDVSTLYMALFSEIEGDI